MPLYTIDRGQVNFTEEESRFASLKALLCSMFYPGMQWIRSFQDQSDGTTRCFYVADRDTDLQYHAAIVGMPCLAVRQVTEVRPGREPGEVIRGGADPEADPEANDPDLLIWVARQRLDGQNDEAVASARWPASSGHAGWLRTFIDREADELFSVFREYSHERARHLAEGCGFGTIEVRQMIQGRPADVVADGIVTGPGAITAK